MSEPSTLMERQCENNDEENVIQPLVCVGRLVWGARLTLFPGDIHDDDQAKFAFGLDRRLEIALKIYCGN